MMMRSVPAPAMRAPIALRHAARSTTSGSRAAFSSVVTPSASVAAIIRFSVPVTVTMSNTNARAVQARRARVDVAVLEVDLGAHRLQALDVLVDRPQADRAAAGQRHARLAAAREQRAERQDRRAHRLDELVRRERPVDACRVERQPSRVRWRRRLTPICASSVLHRAHVVQLRDVGERQRLGRQERRAQDRQRRVLGAGHAHLAARAMAAFDDAACPCVGPVSRAPSRVSAGVSVVIDSAWISSRMRSPSAA